MKNIYENTLYCMKISRLFHGHFNFAGFLVEFSTIVLRQKYRMPNKQNLL